MAATTSSSSYKLRSLITILYRYRLCSANLPQGQYRNYVISQSKYGGHSCGSSMHEGHLRFISSSSRKKNGKPAQIDHMVNIGEKGKVQLPPVPEAPPRSRLHSWAKWLLGSILAILLPFGKQKWERFLMLEGEVVKVVEEVEIAAEVVEKVATTIEKVSEEIADKLPEKGKFKEAALFIEHVSDVTAKDAQLTKDFAQKVDDLTQDLKELETIIEPVIDKKIEK